MSTNEGQTNISDQTTSIPPTPPMRLAGDLMRESIKDMLDAPSRTLLQAFGLFFASVVLTTPLMYLNSKALYELVPPLLGVVVYFASNAILLVVSILSIKQADAKWLGSTKELLDSSKKDFWSIVWITLLIVLLALGSLIPLVIPFFFVMLWMMFVYPALALDGLRGIDAFRYARRLSQGQWWRLMWIFSVPILPLLVAILVIIGMGVILPMSLPLLLDFFLLFIVPFYMMFLSTFQAKVYRSLVNHKGISFDHEKEKGRSLIRGLAIWGAIVSIALVVFVTWSLRQPLHENQRLEVTDTFMTPLV